MSMQMRRLSLVGIIALGLAASAAARTGYTIIDVDVVGLGDRNRDGEAEDLREAEVDAIRRAIERAGVDVQRRTEVRNYVIYEDVVRSEAQGVLLPGYNIEPEGYSDGSQYRVRLKGQVRSNIEGTVAAKSGKRAFGPLISLGTLLSKSRPEWEDYAGAFSYGIITGHLVSKEWYWRVPVMGWVFPFDLQHLFDYGVPGGEYQAEGGLRVLSISPEVGVNLTPEERINAYLAVGGGPYWVNNHTSLRGPVDLEIGQDERILRLGVRVGGGAEIIASDRIGIEVSAFYHRVISPDDISFLDFSFGPKLYY